MGVLSVLHSSWSVECAAHGSVECAAQLMGVLSVVHSSWSIECGAQLMEC